MFRPFGFGNRRGFGRGIRRIGLLWLLWRFFGGRRWGGGWGGGYRGGPGGWGGRGPWWM
ncbi:MAG TPA: hypothetical protein VIG30_17000 [Ktedonobacterales bacterium]|jgi:hypothetical protein